MKKTILPVLAMSVLLVACGGPAPLVSTPIGNIDALPLKVEPLTKEQEKTWGAADLVNDTIPGMSVDKAYAELIKNRKGKPIIVAVIDSGTDIEHEDLDDVIWVNKDEIPNNGKDDDNNGFIDDIHGWNFLGDITEESLEYTRYMRKLGPKFDGKSESAISSADLADYKLYQKAKAEYDKKKGETQANLNQYQQIRAAVKPAHESMAKRLGKEDYTVKDMNGIANPDAATAQQISILTQMFAYSDSVPDLLKQLDEGIEYFGNNLKTHYNVETDYRRVLGDNPDAWDGKAYGNNDVDGPDVESNDISHGTHVAGTIAAERNNGLGMKGVANNAQIMVLRAVPGGDEYDKDIAMAIRYAVDNGAKIINTSFGKYYSPHPEWVWDAIKYAAKNDVLIVNAAGNEGFDLDGIQVYPNDQELDGAEFTDTFLTVGALDTKYGSEMVAGFSNYGATSVDVFAPGVQIWSTYPDNAYEFSQGTSMAAPAVAGVAAMVRSYYPKLSAAQVKTILMQSGLNSTQNVILGGDTSNTQVFNSISKSGKMVNMYNAILMADKMSRQ